jgi:hypothetical protein
MTYPTDPTYTIGTNPSQPLPIQRWATDPNALKDPVASNRTTFGWQDVVGTNLGEIPPLQDFNWQQYATGEWINTVNNKVDYLKNHVSLKPQYFHILPPASFEFNFANNTYPNAGTIQNFLGASSNSSSGFSGIINFVQDSNLGGCYRFNTNNIYIINMCGGFYYNYTNSNYEYNFVPSLSYVGFTAPVLRLTSVAKSLPILSSYYFPFNFSFISQNEPSMASLSLTIESNAFKNDAFLSTSVYFDYLMITATPFYTT